MGKNRARKRARRRTHAANTAGAAPAAPVGTPRLDEAKIWLDQLRADTAALAEQALGIEPGQVDDVEPRSRQPPAPPWKPAA